MPTYTYKARNPEGQPVKGTMEVASRAELVEKLHRMGYVVTQTAEAAPGLKWEPSLRFFQGISLEEKIMFYIQLSNLIHAGIPLLSSLSTLSQLTENRRLKETVAFIARNVEAGSSFSESLAQSPAIFPKLFVSLVKAGEASGKLDTVLSRFASYMEEQAELAQKIKGALFYPLLLLCAGIGVILFIVTAIIPQFVEVFTRTGIALPLPTRMLYAVGIGIKQFWYSIALFAAAGGFALTYYVGTSVGGLQWDRLLLRLPLLGGLFRKAAISRFSRTLGMLIASGVPHLQSLEIVEQVIGNRVLARVVAQAREAVEKGEKISETLRISKEFPADAVQMISVGEETGSLDEMLNKISDFYDRAVGYLIKKLTTVIEPLLLVLMGGLIGFIMASLLLPMFDMMKILRTARTGG